MFRMARAAPCKDEGLDHPRAASQPLAASRREASPPSRDVATTTEVSDFHPRDAVLDRHWKHRDACGLVGVVHLLASGGPKVQWGGDAVDEEILASLPPVSRLRKVDPTRCVAVPTVRAHRAVKAALRFLSAMAVWSTDRSRRCTNAPLTPPEQMLLNGILAMWPNNSSNSSRT